MKTFFTLAITAGLLSLASAAQTASSSASGNANASVAPGQATAGASTNQRVQAPGASANTNANVNASVQAQQSHEPKAKPEPHDTGGKAGNNGASGGHAAAAALGSGTNVQAELSKSLDCKKAKPGDEVSAKVTQDVKSDGRVVIHKGSRLVGHVTEARAQTKEQTNSTLGIAFDKVILKGGEEVSFTSVIQAIAPPVQPTAYTAADENVGLAASPTMSGGGPRAAGPGGGVVGGVTSTAGTAVSGTTGPVVANTTGTVSETVSGATRTAGGLTAQGKLTSASQGAIGLQGLVLSTPAAVTGSGQSSTQGSVITSASRNVKLESGTQMLLRVTGSAQ